MASPNVSELATVAIENRSGKIRDNVTKNNAILAKMKLSGHIRYFSGGTQINEEMSFQQNVNGGSYSGFDLLPVAAQDVLTSAVFNIKQYAVPVPISGLEIIQNSGKERIINLLEGRLGVAEATMANLLSGDLYGDGTGNGGKNLTGLGLGVVTSPSTGVYGGIDRSLWTFWRNQTQASGGMTSSNILTQMNALWAKCVRGKDRPQLIIFDNNFWQYYQTALQAQQRFTDPKVGELGFPAIKYMDADVVLDGGIGGFAPTSQGFFLNFDYLHWRPFKGRDMVPLSPDKRAPINQDAEVSILGFAGNLTCSGAQFQGCLT